jgi:hypothetical protein
MSPPYWDADRVRGAITYTAVCLGIVLGWMVVLLRILGVGVCR